MQPAYPPPFASGRLLLAGAVWLGLAGAALTNQKFAGEYAPENIRGIIMVGLWCVTALAGTIIVYMLSGKAPVRLRLEAAIRISAPPAVAMCFAGITVFRLGLPEVIFVPVILLAVSVMSLWADARQPNTGWTVFITLTALAFVALFSPAMSFWMLAIGCVFLVAAASGSK